MNRSVAAATRARCEGGSLHVPGELRSQYPRSSPKPETSKRSQGVSLVHHGQPEWV